MGKDNKKKKKKTIYVDDGSTIADMSSVGGSNAPRRDSGKSSYPRASFKEQFKTYTDAVKMMFFPMLAVLGMLALAFLIVYILL